MTYMKPTVDQLYGGSLDPEAVKIALVVGAVAIAVALVEVEIASIEEPALN